MGTLSQDPMVAADTSLKSKKPAGPGHTEIRIKGQNVYVPSVEIEGRNVIVTGKWLKIAAVQDQELLSGESVLDPDSFLTQLRASGLRADLFTFIQKLPETEPKYQYPLDWDNVAVIPIQSYSDWWDNRVDPGVRRAVRKAVKAGVVTKVAELDDAFVAGIAAINDESPVRQGRPFWHYQKSLDAVRYENSTYADQNIFLGAYWQDELIGFVRMTCADGCAHILQMLSMMKHYEKRPANALLAKAVEVCESRGMAYLLYCNYVYHDPASSLTEFKRRNGFEKVLLPRYYVPLSLKGRVALALKLHKGLVQRIPKPLLLKMIKLRNDWYARRQKSAEADS
jgi:hypothetical protein